MRRVSEQERLIAIRAEWTNMLLTGNGTHGESNITWTRAQEWIRGSFRFSTDPVNERRERENLTCGRDIQSGNNDSKEEQTKAFLEAVNRFMRENNIEEEYKDRIIQYCGTTRSTTGCSEEPSIIRRVYGQVQEKLLLSSITLSIHENEGDMSVTFDNQHMYVTHSCPIFCLEMNHENMPDSTRDQVNGYCTITLKVPLPSGGESEVVGQRVDCNVELMLQERYAQIIAPVSEGGAGESTEELTKEIKEDADLRFEQIQPVLSVDFDDTLRRQSDNELSPELITLLLWCQAIGVPTFINTDRTFLGGITRFKGLYFEGTIPEEQRDRAKLVFLHSTMQQLEKEYGLTGIQVVSAMDKPGPTHPVGSSISEYAPAGSHSAAIMEQERLLLQEMPVNDDANNTDLSELLRTKMTDDFVQQEKEVVYVSPEQVSYSERYKQPQFRVIQQIMSSKPSMLPPIVHIDDNQEICVGIEKDTQLRNEGIFVTPIHLSDPASASSYVEVLQTAASHFGLNLYAAQLLRTRLFGDDIMKDYAAIRYLLQTTNLTSDDASKKLLPLVSHCRLMILSATIGKSQKQSMLRYLSSFIFPQDKFQKAGNITKKAYKAAQAYLLEAGVGYDRLDKVQDQLNILMSASRKDWWRTSVTKNVTRACKIMAAYEAMLNKSGNDFRNDIIAEDLVALETYMGRIYDDLAFERERSSNVLTSSRLYRRLEKVFEGMPIVKGVVFTPKVGKEVVESIAGVEEAARWHLQLSDKPMEMKMKWDMDDSQVCQDRDGGAGGVRQQSVEGMGGASGAKSDNEDYDIGSEKSICSSESVSSISEEEGDSRSRSWREGKDEEDVVEEKSVQVFPSDLRKIADLLPPTSYAPDEVVRVHQELTKVYAAEQMAEPDQPIEMFYPSTTTEEDIEAAFHHIYQTALEYLKVKEYAMPENDTVANLLGCIQRAALTREKDGVYHALYLIYIAKVCERLTLVHANDSSRLATSLYYRQAVAEMLGVLSLEKQRGDGRCFGVFKNGHSRLTKVIGRDVVVREIARRVKPQSFRGSEFSALQLKRYYDFMREEFKANKNLSEPLKRYYRIAFVNYLFEQFSKFFQGDAYKKEFLDLFDLSDIELREIETELNKSKESAETKVCVLYEKADRDAWLFQMEEAIQFERAVVRDLPYDCKFEEYPHLLRLFYSHISQEMLLSQDESMDNVLPAIDCFFNFYTAEQKERLCRAMELLNNELIYSRNGSTFNKEVATMCCALMVAEEGKEAEEAAIPATGSPQPTDSSTESPDSERTVYESKSEKDKNKQEGTVTSRNTAEEGKEADVDEGVSCSPVVLPDSVNGEMGFRVGNFRDEDKELPGPPILAGGVSFVPISGGRCDSTASGETGNSVSSPEPPDGLQGKGERKRAVSEGDAGRIGNLSGLFTTGRSPDSNQEGLNADAKTSVISSVDAGCGGH